jgi:hypothetical protein
MHGAHITRHGSVDHHAHHHTHAPISSKETHTRQSVLGGDSISFASSEKPHDHTIHSHDDDHDHSHSHGPPQFSDALGEHPLLRILQACTGLLMIPMMFYAIYTTLHSGYRHESEMPDLAFSRHGLGQGYLQD